MDSAMGLGIVAAVAVGTPTMIWVQAKKTAQVRRDRFRDGFSAWVVQSTADHTGHESSGIGEPAAAELELAVAGMTRQLAPPRARARAARSLVAAR